MRRFSHLVSLTLLAAMSWGCGQNDDSGPTPEPSRGGKDAVDSEKPQVAPAGYERLHQSFADATRKDAPEGWRPADRTMTGKSVGKLYEQVVQSWDGIKFMKLDGTRIQYTARIDTELGTIELALDSEAAPNHVRSFIALSRAGYYDGLVFDRIYHTDGNLEDGGRFEEIEAGCPLGTGAAAQHSIGYWLKPEFAKEAVHAAGSVGACRGLEEDSAACKFYIALNKAPYLDGKFTLLGRVTSGIEVARKIFLQPVVIDEEDEDGSRRPVKPVVMRKVSIQER